MSPGPGCVASRCPVVPKKWDGSKWREWVGTLCDFCYHVFESWLRFDKTEGMSFCYFALSFFILIDSSTCVLETACLQWLHLTVGSNIGGCEYLRTNLSDHSNNLPTSGHPIFGQNGKTVCLQEYYFHVEQHESKQILSWFLVGNDTLPKFFLPLEVRSEENLSTWEHSLFLPAHGETRTLYFFWKQTI